MWFPLIIYFVCIPLIRAPATAFCTVPRNTGNTLGGKRPLMSDNICWDCCFGLRHGKMGIMGIIDDKDGMLVFALPHVWTNLGII